jgi:MFS family permease
MAKFRITTRHALTNILLVTNAFIWYYYALYILQDIVREMSPDYFTNVLIWSIHFSGIIFSALVGASLVEKIGGRVYFLIIWMILGIVSPLTLILMNSAYALSVLALSFILGASLGLGMPNCMGYYTDCTNIETRGCLGGIIILVSSLGFFLLDMAAMENLLTRAFVLSFWRLGGLVTFLIIKPHDVLKEKSGDSAYRILLGRRSFLLYFIPWTMFSLVNYLSTPVLSQIIERFQAELLLIIGNVFMGISAIVGGFLSDTIGRKRMAITGFVMLGFGYSILGIYPENLFSWYFHNIIDGVAWGILFVIFVITIWGDLSYDAPSDKYYAVGVLPFFISKFLQLTVGEYIAAIIPSYAIFSFVAFFLFLAVIPLMFAPESLPEKAIRERELRSYVEKAKKIKEKFT